MLDSYQEFVVDYTTTNLPLRKILNQDKFKTIRFISVLKSISSLNITDDKKTVLKVFNEAEEFDNLDYNPLAKMIFYNRWCMQSQWHGLGKQAEIILEKLKRLNPLGAPPILLSEKAMTIAYVAESKEAYFEKLIDEFNKYGKTSPRYKQHIDNYVKFKCFGCMGNSIIKTENTLELYKNEISTDRDILFYKFANDLGTCDLISIQTYFQKLDFNWPDIGPMLLLHDLLLKKNINISEVDTSYRFDVGNTLKTNYYLMMNDIKSALKELQKIKSGILNHFIYNFLKYTAIRVELCNKNVEAAFQLLKTKINESEKHYMDNFFLARVELLRGNKEKAFQYFKKTYHECEHYSALNRIQVELDMALEIKGSDLFFLTKNLFQNTNNSPIDINYDEIIISEKLVGVERLVGKSESLNKIKANIISYSATNLPLLITGETGVGKDVVARAIHEESPRNIEPFLAINCGAITESLLQSELFGHLAGSYTGANSGQKGVFIEAGKGTVFLDEIGEISPAIQVALLRVLENNEVKPVGGSHQIAFQCRIIAATNANLEELVLKKSFRLDLYYRLKRLEIIIPPLRERKEDIIPLTNHYLKSFRHSNTAPILSADLKEALLNYQWPGNIRQLRNEIEKMDLLKSRKSNYELKDCDFLMCTNNATNTITLPQNAAETKEEQINNLQEESLTTWRRHEEIRNLFLQFKNLTRKEISNKMNISLSTATSDLKKLVKEQFIFKVKPSASTRSHYFVLTQKK